MNKDEFDEFISTEIKPKTIEYVRQFISSTPLAEIPLFYYDVIISLGMAGVPSKNRKIQALEEHEGDVSAAKRSIMDEIINELNQI